MPALKALIVEDDPDDATLIVHRLREAGYELHWNRVDCEPDFLAALDWPLDIILSDFSMPRFNGLRALELLRASGRQVPLILISGTVGEDVAVEAMRIGATDYLLKDRIARLPSAVERALAEKRLQAERLANQRALHKSDQRLRSIVERSMDCIMVVDRQGRIEEMNHAGLAMLQAEKLAALQGRRFVEFVVPAHRGLFDDLQQRALDGAATLATFEISGCRGRSRWLEVQAGPLMDAENRVEAMICITRDVTERQLAEEQIRSQLVELQRWRDVTMGREDRVLALKGEVNGLLAELGRAARYDAVAPPASTGDRGAAT
ncbi:MAG: PAS domain-containing protein [Gammaproteobacteria bacterium]|nr:PAS domain-containing protein [Gammaproteobacteria bacterium]